MRAGLIAAALVFAAAVEPASAAPAPVPCTNIGGGQYECSWYRPGDGFSGGSLVVVGTTTVGYLHQGRNWVVCQQTGGDMYNAEGNRNNWFGWTQADNDKWGWASPLDASGGDNYGPFGGGTPLCNGAHGSPPAYNGLWGSPPPATPGATPTPAPAPGTPAVDADKDGTPASADCDDTNSKVYPGRPEVPNDDVDQDCNGTDAAGPLNAVIAFAFQRGRSSTKLTSLRVTDSLPGATVTVTCSGKRKRCPKPKTFTTSAKGSVSLTRMFRKRLRPGAVITVQVTATNRVGKVKRLTIRRRQDPRSQTLCLPPGSQQPTRC
jgi:hypothetical protein